MVGPLTLLLGGLLALPALAGGLRDPTAPPPELQASAGQASLPAQARALQAIVAGGERPAAAVIDGQMVPLGGWLGESRLIAIKKDSVILDSPEGRQTLRLLPGMDKRLLGAPTAPRHSTRPTRKPKQDKR